MHTMYVQYLAICTYKCTHTCISNSKFYHKENHFQIPLNHKDSKEDLISFIKIHNS